MTPLQTLMLICTYFLVILGISWFVSMREKTSLKEYFLASKSVPWWLVAFGMIGNSLSGVTFISVPGRVGEDHMVYFQTVIGYLLGYVAIAFVLLPLYYRLNLTTIYTFLKMRLGNAPYKTAAIFFLISRLLGASARLYLVTGVLQVFIFQHWGVPLPVTAAIALLLILFYTVDGGMKILVWTDTLQSLFLVSAVIITVILLGLDMNANPISLALDSPYGQLFNWDIANKHYFWKDVLGGMFITITMTGLDQDQMQKNLICKDIRSAQKNMLSFSLIVIIVNFFFLTLGALLYIYIERFHVQLPPNTPTDHTYPFLALEVFSDKIFILEILFMLGLTAAAFSSADGALTALTTSFMIDIMNRSTEDPKSLRVKKFTHYSMALAAYISILIFYLSDEYTRANGGKGLSIISVVLNLATYTYGPLLGLYAFGLFTKLRIREHLAPVIAVLSPLLCLLINYLTSNQLGFLTLLLNGALTFVGLLLIARPSSSLPPVAQPNA